MRSVVNLVLVRWSPDAAAAETPWFKPSFDISQDATYACQYVEKYPGDFRWRCGICKRGEVRPVVGAFCSNCSAYVTQIGRDEDEKGRELRELQDTWRKQAGNPPERGETFKQWERELERITARRNKLQAEMEMAPPEKNYILTNITAYGFEGGSETPKKNALKPLPEQKPRKIEL